MSNNTVNCKRKLKVSVQLHRKTLFPGSGHIWNAGNFSYLNERKVFEKCFAKDENKFKVREKLFKNFVFQNTSFCKKMFFKIR